MLRILRRKKFGTRLAELESRLHETKQSVESVRKMLERQDALIRQLHADSWNVNGIRSESIQGVVQIEASQLQQLIRQLNDDASAALAERFGHLHRLIEQNHADNWDADERRALSLADVVLLSMTPRIDSMRQELIALVGEKAVEVFRERSKED